MNVTLHAQDLDAAYLASLRPLADALNGIHLNRLKSNDLRFIVRELQRASLLLASDRTSLSYGLRCSLYERAFQSFAIHAGFDSPVPAKLPFSLRERRTLKLIQREGQKILDDINDDGGAFAM